MPAAHSMESENGTGPNGSWSSGITRPGGEGGKGVKSAGGGGGGGLNEEQNGSRCGYQWLRKSEYVCMGA